ncbi:branched-chain amino acid ABC transporter ATP-binding protein/permease [Patulibacter brassicae]|uniref:Branched-chain amino acid ABC transporter ATP-binding protein/permease n=1 Tax=Patulibacter brassicae TaxID=1705717 RepID=A0ABU4VM00_9ACTN|nr:branched-chain amino acid ABC transporter ATP-binding protein/permease [Patulibacter brassicae]MDX8152699.1 branched-chain amino acid ABC transporter ATP-binding protein/permease [Patulibacter brassicae]
MTSLLKRLAGGTGSRSVKAELRGDVLFALVIGVVGLIAILPGRDGAGTAMADMQLVGSIFAVIIAAIGLNLLTGYAKLVSLGQGAFYAIGAYGFAYLFLDGGFPALLAILVALILSGIIGALLALGSMRLRGPQFSMITLVLAIVVERILEQLETFGRASGYPNPLSHGTGLLEPIELFGTRLEPPLLAGTPGNVLVALLIVLVIVLVLYRNLVRSSWGRSLRAIGESEHLAAHLGVNVFSRKVVVFTVASVLGGLGGIFYVQIFAHLQPETFDIFLSITIVLSVILGGGGTVLGPVIGAALITWLQRSDVLTSVADAQQDLFGTDRWYLSTPGLLGLLFVITLFLLPNGIVGTANNALRRWAGADDESDADAALADLEVAQLPPREERREPGAELLRIDGASKRFGGLQAVGEMELAVREASIHAVIGPNGAGKSTLANLLTGVYQPDEGSFRLDGVELAQLKAHAIARSGVARTFQTPQVFPHETTLENVKAGFVDVAQLPLWKAALKPPSQYRREREIHDRAIELLDRVGLAEDASTLAGSLSYGKQRALEIARAMAMDPRLIVLDEPAAGLNPTECDGLAALLLQLREDGMAMILVEHHMDLVGQVADEVTCMDQGRLLAHGSAEEVLADPAVVAAYLGVPDPDDVAEMEVAR